MRARTGFAFALLTLIACARPATADAQCTTPPKKFAPALNGKDAYALARAEATRWRPDSVLIRMHSTTAGPMDSAGLAGHWMLEFYSKATKKLDVLNIMKGELMCSIASVEILAEPVAMTADVILDTQRIYGIAQQAGGSAQDPKHVSVTARLEESADNGPVWTVTYASPQGMPLLSLKIDARTGAVIPKTARF